MLGNSNWVSSSTQKKQKTSSYLRLIRRWWVQHGARNLSGKKNKTSVVPSWVERAHLSTRRIQRTTHPVVVVHTKRVKRRKSIHTLWIQLKCVSPQMTVIRRETKTEKGPVFICVRRRQPSLSLHCLSLTLDEHTAIKVNHDLFDSLRQWVVCFSARPIHTCTMSFFRLEYGFTEARKSPFWCRI